MTTAARKKRPARFPRNKIHSVVQTVLPKGAGFQMQVIDSKIGRMKIVRVVTPVWKTLTPSDRILRILKATNSALSDDERKNILRFSVLTPEEMKLMGHKPARTRPAYCRTRFE
jgi:hypothetical protein